MIYFIIIYAIIGLFFFLLSRHFSVMQGDWDKKRHRYIAAGLAIVWPAWFIAAILLYFYNRRRYRKHLSGKE